jgi:hypothetical protein
MRWVVRDVVAVIKHLSEALRNLIKSLLIAFSLAISAVHTPHHFSH